MTIFSAKIVSFRIVLGFKESITLLIMSRYTVTDAGTVISIILSQIIKGMVGADSDIKLFIIVFLLKK